MIRPSGSQYAENVLGPGKGGPHAPYFQSERLDLYHSYTNKLLDVTLTITPLVIKPNLTRLIVRTRIPMLLHPRSPQRHSRKTSSDRFKHNLRQDMPPPHRRRSRSKSPRRGKINRQTQCASQPPIFHLQ